MLIYKTKYKESISVAFALVQYNVEDDKIVMSQICNFLDWAEKVTIPPSFIEKVKACYKYKWLVFISTYLSLENGSAKFFSVPRSSFSGVTIHVY